MAIAPFHDGRTLLFLGQCLEVSVFDVETGEKLDYNDAGPGRPGFDATVFGQGFTSFTASPDGHVLYAVPATKSVIHFNFQIGTGSQRVTFDRHMILPFDMSQGTRPELLAEYAKENIDDWEGLTGIGVYETPAIDPGIDIRYAYRNKYQVYWAPDTAGSIPSVLPTGPTVAVGNNTLWLRGSGIPGVSGLGWAGNLGVSALQTNKQVLWPRGDDPFFGVWLAGPAPDDGFGYDLTPESVQEVATYGLLYMPAP
jgi:hypothetical protein